MNDTIEKLRATARQAQEAIGEIESAERRKVNGAKVGRYFKTRNNYSCPEKPSDYWWLYSKVTHMDEDGFLHTMQFQTCKHNHVNIEFDHFGYHMEGHVEIKRAEFDRAWRAMRDKIGAAYSPARSG